MPRGLPKRCRSEAIPDLHVLVLLLAAACLGCTDDPAPPTATDPSPKVSTLAATAPNGCEPDAAVDRSADDEVEILFGDMLGYRYEPNCVAVRVGTQLRFRGEFAVHPLEPGTVVGLEV